MSQWWDNEASCYKATLPYKVFYVWGWPLIRWVMYNLPPETAHNFGIRGILLEEEIQRLWDLVMFALALLAIGVIRLLLFIPGFHCTPPTDVEPK